MQTFLLVFSLIFAFFALLKSLIVVDSRSICAMFRFGKFQRAYGPGVHFIFNALTLKKITLREGMRVGIVSKQEIEIEDCRIRVNFLEDPIIGNSGFIVGFSNYVPRVSQKQEIFANNKDNHDVNSQEPNGVSLGQRLIFIVMSIMPIIEGYNTLTTGYTTIRGKHGGGIKVEGDWAIICGVFFILFGLFLLGVSLGIIKRRSRCTK